MSWLNWGGDPGAIWSKSRRFRELVGSENPSREFLAIPGLRAGEEGEKWISYEEQARRQSLYAPSREKARRREEGRTSLSGELERRHIELARERADRSRPPRPEYTKEYLVAKGMKRRNPSENYSFAFLPHPTLSVHADSNWDQVASMIRRKLGPLYDVSGGMNTYGQYTKEYPVEIVKIVDFGRNLIQVTVPRAAGGSLTGSDVQYFQYMTGSRWLDKASELVERELSQDGVFRAPSPSATRRNPIAFKPEAFDQRLRRMGMTGHTIYREDDGEVVKRPKMIMFDSPDAALQALAVFLVLENIDTRGADPVEMTPRHAAVRLRDGRVYESSLQADGKALHVGLVGGKSKVDWFHWARLGDYPALASSR